MGMVRRGELREYDNDIYPSEKQRICAKSVDNDVSSGTEKSGQQNPDLTRIQCI
jgi:hypothetical protein